MGSGTELCDKTTKIISGILLSMGSGVPDPGDIFTTGSSLLRQVSDKMELAIPGANWIGASAAAYSSQNLAQQLRTKAMSDIDKLAGNLVSNQARHIRDARKVLSAMITMVNGVRKACKKLEKVPLVGKGLSLALAVPPCGTAMSVVGGALLYLTLTTMNNVMNLKGLLGRLIEMLTALPKFAGLPKLPIPGLPEIAWPPKLPEIPIPGLPSIPGLPEFNWPPTPGAPDFTLPIPGLPEFQWPSMPGFPQFNWPRPGFPIPGFPGLPGLPTIPDVFPGLPVLDDLLSGVGILGRLPTWVEVASLPEFLAGFAGLPSLDFGELLSFAQLPAVGQLTETMNQLAQLASAGGHSSNIVNMAGQQTPMISSLGRQSGPPQGILGVDTDNEVRTDAAAGATVERAPIDTASDGTQLERRLA